MHLNLEGIDLFVVFASFSWLLLQEFLLRSFKLSSLVATIKNLSGGGSLSSKNQHLSVFILVVLLLFDSMLVAIVFLMCKFCLDFSFFS
ncbi:hypothetical protein MANES_12G058560v8 [Manihot esculenta]|uniref:RIN4 pathogenic type III effector avirulence factor Avr cleavage site domain-containing protein n=1 Tax=Manihot esculenta TaxID=3983 RepID=A0A2C9UW36_MANES|nr:hypothetical protein MANES_12G058560v8 [Manihot esculenta]